MTESPPPFRDPGREPDQRVDDLLSRLTADERLALLHQFAPAVDRLGIGAFRTGQEALHGVAWMGPATVFPQAVGLGATWNDDLLRRIGEAVSVEARAMRSRDERVGLNVWAPTVNLLRHPLWGRNEEGYAEDPHLTSALAAAYTRGLRGDHPTHWRTAPVLKHWLAHNNETDRDTSNASVRPRVLHEYDLRAFRHAVEAGAVAGVMPAYNLVNGRPNHVSPYLREQLRRWTDDELLVCSDAGAPSNLVDSQHYFATHEEAVAAALVAGVDSFTDHGTDPTVVLGRLRRALAAGLLSGSDVDAAVRRHLTVRLRLGEFDPDGGPYGSADASDVDTAAHRELAREAAEQAVVLLKNDGLLPLAPPSGNARVAVVGLLADECKTDWYSGTLIRRSTVLDGLRERFGAERVVCAEGVDRVRLKCAGGWLRVPASAAAAHARVAAGTFDPALLAGRTDLPPVGTCAAAADATEFALVDWGEGAWTLRAPDGRHLSVAADGFVRASADQPGGWVVQETFALVSAANGDGDGEGGRDGDGSGDGHAGGHLLRHTGTGGYVCVAADGVKVAADGEVLPAERATPFTVEVLERGEDAVARAAAAADTVIVVAGNDPHINGRETQDRTTLALPPHQDRLWRAARAANPRTALVLVSAYPYAVTDADAELPALLWTAHGGQAAGTALARVIAGDVSPAGRLPQTWYAADTDLPDLLDYDIIGSRQTYQYFDGTPLYPFGHGLGYSSFRYEDLTAERDGDALRVAVTLTNTGAVTADEVVQLYTRAPRGPVALPHRRLAAHRRVRLAHGAWRRLAFRLPLTDLGFWDVRQDRWALPPGTYELLAGASSRDIRLMTPVELTGEPLAARPVLGAGLAANGYDTQRGTELVDRTKTSGDAVHARDDGTGELLYQECDFGDGVAAVTVEAAGEGAVDLIAGTTAATVTVTPTGGPYHYASHTSGFAVSGVRDLRVRLRGPVRLARIAFTATGPRKDAA
ncbi:MULTISPECIES: glycoside hydrolase family 3 C-terminal domain-containing protein [Streptomyces]|uniref:glycoside hydrolase family 3 C-terminal domain-containing protein n=1 Tax=Streptomyces TaxID=1883 RepID=UPI001E5738FE|nr:MULTISPECIES: glycoside hydrolase family 3 C-terminal domain-containing protein [Streptomyces]UFQ19142.1 glycoside hydrolase family 3 C-terminal domain-containing protein [Streptomyces huasconensis]WCL88762.1 glycoside hydrolase family 3 C-terminal domain-containing protein [Streptomyces sp. JCM 35825]